MIVWVPKDMPKQKTKPDPDQRHTGSQSKTLIFHCSYSHTQVLFNFTTKRDGDGEFVIFP